MKDYSQNGEQRVILNYFGYTAAGESASSAGATRSLTVLDVGANDGMLLSNSRALVELGFNAVLVEPAEIPFKKLHGLYNHETLITNFRYDQVIHCINAAITLADGPLEFYSSGTHLKKGDTDLLSTSKPEELERWRKSGEVFTKTSVRGITFETLMRETGVSHFDFISVDAEGADWDIVKQIDLTAVGCRMLCVEVNARGDGVFTDYAGQFGMRLHWRSHENRIYVK